jgi:predicted phage-related endonuclease
MLTETQKLARAGKLTASRVACLMTGDKVKIIQLWREMCGDPTYVEESLDEVWAVRLGETTESLNLEWYEKIKGKALTRKGEVVVHPDYPWAAATIDAYDLSLPGPVECKHVGGFEKFDTVLARYQPQVHWQMECTQSRYCALSVIEGARQPRIEIIEYDKGYAEELMSRALKFMEHIWNMTEPVVLDPVVLASRTKEYDMTGHNQWAAFARDFLDHQKAAKTFKYAETELKGLVPNDASTATGHGVVAKRDRALRVSIRASEDNGGNQKSKR